MEKFYGFSGTFVSCVAMRFLCIRIKMNNLYSLINTNYENEFIWIYRKYMEIQRKFQWKFWNKTDEKLSHLHLLMWTIKDLVNILSQNSNDNKKCLD